MENHDNVDISISVGAACASRWNPTKEQTDMLESLYRQGIRTPSAEQIQQITNKLRAFGHIEGKNAFYWFQNHKARQRQKQKQDQVSYFNRFLLKTSVLPPCSNVLCSPFYMPYPEMRSCQQQQQPKVRLPKSFKRRPTLPEKLEKSKLCGRAIYDQANWVYNHIAVMHQWKANEDCVMTTSQPCNQETLDLFPLHPTGNLQSRTEAASFSLRSTSVAIPPTSSATKSITDQEASNGHPFFDFLCGNGSRCDGH